MSVLAEILASKRGEILDARARPPPARSPRVPNDPLGTLARGAGEPLRLIAEVKFKSPSAGELSRALDAPSRARAYAKAGAKMVSILCDAPFFGGSFAHLAATRALFDAEGLTVPLLAKEFILDEVQLDLAAAHGADAALLIVRILEGRDLGRLIAASRDRGLEPLVEVVDEAELGAAIAAGARIIGVNARDLDTLAMDAARAARVLASIPRDRVAVHLSGIKSAEAVAAVGSGRADAALLGEALMRIDDPTPFLRELVAATEQ